MRSAERKLQWLLVALALGLFGCPSIRFTVPPIETRQTGTSLGLAAVERVEVASKFALKKGRFKLGSPGQELTLTVEEGTVLDFQGTFDLVSGQGATPDTLSFSANTTGATFSLNREVTVSRGFASARFQSATVQSGEKGLEGEATLDIARAVLATLLHAVVRTDAATNGTFDSMVAHVDVERLDMLLKHGAQWKSETASLVIAQGTKLLVRDLRMTPQGIGRGRFELELSLAKGSRFDIPDQTVNAGTLSARFAGTLDATDELLTLNWAKAPDATLKGTMLEVSHRPGGLQAGEARLRLASLQGNLGMGKLAISRNAPEHRLLFEGGSWAATVAEGTELAVGGVQLKVEAGSRVSTSELALAQDRITGKAQVQLTVRELRVPLQDGALLLGDAARFSTDLTVAVGSGALALDGTGGSIRVERPRAVDAAGAETYAAKAVEFTLGEWKHQVAGGTSQTALSLFASGGQIDGAALRSGMVRSARILIPELSVEVAGGASLAVRRVQAAQGMRLEETGAQVALPTGTLRLEGLTFSLPAFTFDGALAEAAAIDGLDFTPTLLEYKDVSGRSLVASSDTSLGLKLGEPLRYDLARRQLVTFSKFDAYAVGGLALVDAQGADEARLTDAEVRLVGDLSGAKTLTAQVSTQLAIPAVLPAELGLQVKTLELGLQDDRIQVRRLEVEASTQLEPVRALARQKVHELVRDKLGSLFGEISWGTFKFLNGRVELGRLDLNLPADRPNTVDVYGEAAVIADRKKLKFRFRGFKSWWHFEDDGWKNMADARLWGRASFTVPPSPFLEAKLHPTLTLTRFAGESHVSPLDWLRVDLGLNVALPLPPLAIPSNARERLPVLARMQVEQVLLGAMAGDAVRLRLVASERTQPPVPAPTPAPPGKVAVPTP